jgi:hypothetical protein
MPHTHYTTLISATNLAERLAEAPGSVFVIDCRFDLADPEAGEKAYLSPDICRARIICISTATCRGRRPARTGAIRCRIASGSSKRWNRAA